MNDMIEFEIDFGLLDGDIWKEKQDKLVNWCKENCTNYYIYDCYTCTMKFSFVNEQDAIAFKLRWS